MEKYAEQIAAIRAQGGTDADVAAYLRSKGVTETTTPAHGRRVPSAREIAARNAADPERQRTTGDELAAAFVSALDAGTFGLAGLATDALSPGSFRANRDARRAEYQRMPTSDRILSGIAGGLANPVSRVIPGGAAAPRAGGLLPVSVRIAGRGMAEGAAQGALTGLGENIGTTDGATDDVVAGGIVGGLFGGAIAPVASRVATAGRHFADPLTQFLPDAFGGGAAAGRLAETRTAVNAARRAAEGMALDAERGIPLPTPYRVPGAMAVDAVGPTTMAQARGAARTVEGREAFRAPFAEREASMIPLITEDAPDAVAEIARRKAARKVRADADYDAAVEATKGQPIETPTLDALLQTRAGRAAWNEVQAQRPDLVVGVDDPARALPTVEREVLEGVSPDAPEGFVPNSATRGRMEQRPVPDAEAIHLISRFLRNRSKTAPGQTFPDGVTAEDAGNALLLLGKAKDELPEPFRRANATYARLSDEIDALEMGRTPWKLNPTAKKVKKGAARPIGDVEREVARMSPEEQGLVRVGKYFDLTSRINEGTLTPEKAMRKLNSPSSSLARELQVAGMGLENRLRAWDNAMARQSDILSGGNPRMSASGGLLEEASRDIAPNAVWATVKAIRNRLSAKAMKDAGTNDAAFARLLTSPPETWNAVIANLAKRDAAAAEATRRAAGMVGRSSVGLLEP